MTTLKEETGKSIIWTTLERLSVQGIQFIVSMIVARILMPSDYGLIAMITIFLSLSDAIINGGFGMALIRKQNVKDDDYATAFTFNVLCSIIFYSLLFFFAPYISSFYAHEKICPILRVLALTLIINSFGIVQNTQLISKLKFKFSTKISIISSFSSGLASILFAVLGFGVWTIVIQSLIYSTLNTILLYHFIRWKPRFLFKKESFKYLFRFGINIQFTNILNSIYNNIYSLIIGKYYTATDLGLYNRGYTIAILIPNLSLGIFSKISLPILSKIQNDNLKMQNALIKLLKVTSFIIFPAMGTLTILAAPFISVLLSNKWIDCVLYIQIFAITSCFIPISSLNQAIPLVKGRSDYTFKIELIKKVISIIGIYIVLPMGIKPLAIFASAWNLGIYIADIMLTYKLINLSPIKQALICLKPILSTILMMIITAYSIAIINNNLLKLIIGGFEAIFIYLIINKYIIKNTILYEISDYLKKMVLHKQ